MEFPGLEKQRDLYEFNVNPKDAPVVERSLFKYTKRDTEIHNLPVPAKPIWLKIIIRLIRFYRKKISKRLGNRCVFDPSCSHYAESAFRKKGFFKGLKMTIFRLRRCRPANGGVDEVH